MMACPQAMDNDFEVFEDAVEVAAQFLDQDH
jgi:hypothetical protein